jgi:hypothetical protein
MMFLIRFASGGTSILAAHGGHYEIAMFFFAWGLIAPEIIEWARRRDRSSSATRKS